MARRGKAVVALAAVALLLASCGSRGVREWQATPGATGRVREIAGDDDHCDFGSVRYLRLTDGGSGAYVRDARGAIRSFPGYEDRTLDLHAELPADAIDTGWQASDGSRLWRSADGGYVYLVRGRWVERWPWADPAPWCA